MFKEVESKVHQSPTQLPVRATQHSAGYDFYLKETIVLQPHETKLSFTDVKCHLLDDTFLSVHIRSSVGVKKHIMLANGTGIIDSDYYNNSSNDGNIGIALHNYGQKAITLEAGERVAQGIIQAYRAFDKIDRVRGGGFGSTES